MTRPKFILLIAIIATLSGCTDAVKDPSNATHLEPNPAIREPPQGGLNPNETPAALSFSMQNCRGLGFITHWPWLTHPPNEKPPEWTPDFQYASATVLFQYQCPRIVANTYVAENQTIIMERHSNIRVPKACMEYGETDDNWAISGLWTSNETLSHEISQLLEIEVGTIEGAKISSSDPLDYVGSWTLNGHKNEIVAPKATPESIGFELSARHAIFPAAGGVLLLDLTYSDWMRHEAGMPGTVDLKPPHQTTGGFEGPRPGVTGIDISVDIDGVWKKFEDPACEE